MINMSCKTLTLTEWVLGNKGHPPKEEHSKRFKSAFKE